MNEPTLDDLQRAQRLQELGIEIRSAELREYSQELHDFHARGGNRAMRRAARRAMRKTGSRYR